jgi:hypothetical protein
VQLNSRPILHTLSWTVRALRGVVSCLSIS